MDKRWLLAVAVACSSSRHEPREPAPAPGYDPTTVPVMPAPDPTTVPVAPPPRPVAQPAPACAGSVPKGCPATEPNINHPCSTKGLQCTYGPSCCPPVYVCNGAGVFEAHFTHCT